MSGDALRIALVSTPRVGNTWVRYLLADAYQIPGLAYHELTPDRLRDLPAACVMQIHWRREPAFEAALRDHGFQMLTVSRHPFDVLLSILQFAVHEPQTAQWLLGRGGDESGIWGAMPRSRSFVEYATSSRAVELLSVTCDWWDQPGVAAVRYEAFVLDPVHELTRLADVYGPPRVDPVAVTERSAREKIPTTNSHFWQGRPGLWRSLLPASEAREIAAVQAPILARLGYPCDPDPHLSPSEADRNWVRLAGPPLRSALARSTSVHQDQLDQLRERVRELEASRHA